MTNTDFINPTEDFNSGVFLVTKVTKKENW